MTTTTDILDRLRPHYRIEQVGAGRYALTPAQEDEPGPPAILDLDDHLVEAHVQHLARSSEGGDLTAAAGLVAIHIEEEVESALATGGVLHALGLRRARISRRPQWYVDRTPGPTPDLGPGEFEWRT